MSISTGSKQLIAEFYEAAFEPQHWKRAFASLCHFTRSTGVVITTSATDLEFHSHPYIYSTNPAGWEIYYNELVEICPRFSYARRTKPKGIFADYHHTNEDAMDNSEFYDRLERHCGTRYYMAKLLPITDYSIVHFSLHRKASHGHYQSNEMQLLEQLAPHILRALQINTKISTQNCPELTSSPTRANNNCVIVLDSNGVPIHITEQAEKVIKKGDGLAIQSAALVSGYRPDQAKLEKLITSAIRSSTSAEQSPAGLIALRKQSGERPYNVLICPMHRRDNLNPLLDAAAAVFIADPELYVMPDMQFLCELYRFTPKEASLVAAFIRSGSLPETTIQLGISRNTARAHLQNIFRKTATSSQAELLKLMLSS